MSDDLHVEFERSNDLLRRDVRTLLAFETTMADGRVRFESNSSTVIGILRACFGEEAGGPGADAVVRVIVIEGADSPATIRHLRLDRERTLIATSSSLGLADARRAEGLLYVTPVLVRDRARFAADFVAPVARGALGADAHERNTSVAAGDE